MQAEEDKGDLFHTHLHIQPSRPRPEDSNSRAPIQQEVTAGNLKLLLLNQIFSQCTRGIPCERCVIDGTECFLDEELDGRRKVALKRKIEKLEETRDTLVKFIHIVRNSDAHDPILQAIRNGATLEQVTVAIAARSQGIKNTGSGENQRKSKCMKFVGSSPGVAS